MKSLNIKIIECSEEYLADVVSMINKGRELGAFHGNNDLNIELFTDYILSLKNIKKYLLYIAIVNELVAGYIDFSLNYNHPLIAKIEGIFVKPEYREFNISNLLLNNAINKIKEYKYNNVFTEVYFSNFLGRAFFTYNGFIKVGTSIEDISGKEIITYMKNLF